MDLGQANGERERAQEPLSSGCGEKQRTKALEDMISIWLRQQ